MTYLKTDKKNYSNPPKRRSSPQNRAAVAAVEFAVVAPFLILIIFMMIESSRFLTATHATTAAAREAARVSAVSGASNEEATQVAKDLIAASYFDTETVEVIIEASDSSVSGMKKYSCKVAIDFEAVSVIGDPFNLGVAKVKGHSAMLAPE